MQKWEYIHLTVDSIGLVKYINGENAEKGLYRNKTFFGSGTTQKMQEPRLYEYLVEAGQNGWEVCGMTTAHDDYMILILKRPLG
jgi:hypothetical protein